VAIWVRLDKFRHQATLDLRVDYLRPATPELILRREDPQ